MSRLLRVTPIIVVLLVAACGTVATPVWSEQAQGTQAALAATSEHETANAPTATPTTPPTSAPTDAPTNTPAPSATPTSEPPTATSIPASATPAPVVAAPSGDAEHGKALFETFYDQVSFACNTCHHVDSEDRLIGPGLLNVSTRAATRVEGQTAEVYIHNSIVNPSAFVVPDYPDGLMPQVYQQILSEADIQDIIAYLFTLK